MPTGTETLQKVFGLVVAVFSAFVGWYLFVTLPTSLFELLGVLLVLAVVLVGFRFGRTFASKLFPSYNVAEVAVEGRITRDGSSGPSVGPDACSANDVVDLIEQADADRHVDALVVRLNTRGGAIVPSEDIRLAAESFDGPTIAYAEDICASGGYWIACGCDELWGRKGSVIGSIGVTGSKVFAPGLLEKAGMQYEEITAGEYKEAGVPFSGLEDSEREYLQERVDEFYRQFVETVTTGRELDEGAVRETQAKMYLGEEAEERELIDEIGTRDAIEDRLEDLLESDVSVVELQRETTFLDQLTRSAAAVSRGFGAGIGSQLTGSENGFEFRT